MQAFADFASSLFGGAILISVALALGGLVFARVVVRPLDDGTVLRRSLALVVTAALAVGGLDLVHLALTVAVLREWAGPGALGDFVGTLQARAGAVQVALALALACAAAWLRRAPRRGARWVVAGMTALALAVSGAWLAHAAGRLEDREALMTYTVLHEVGAALWVGGVGQLVVLHALARRDADARECWPALVRGFAVLAVTGVVVIVASGVALARPLVGSLGALTGSAYGSLVTIKAALMAVALGFGATTFSLARGNPDATRWRVPALVQAESLVLAGVVFTAASLATQPPSVDTTRDHATLAEVAEVFRPKVPALHTPPIATMIAEYAEPRNALDGTRTNAAYLWSNFSHNVAGILLLAMSVTALWARWHPTSIARHWAVGFLVLAVFVFLRASANDGIWPFGPIGVWESMRGDAEVLQHRLGALLAFLLGAVEWHTRVRARRRGGAVWIFPMLAWAGGVLLLTHSHSAFEPKPYFLVQITHTTMGALAVLLAVGRVLEIHLDGAAGRAAGAVAETAMVLIALVLLFYREANVVVPPGAA